MGWIPASTMSRATWIPWSRNSSAAAFVIARTPNEPAAQSPRPAIARRAEPPVTWTSVAGSPWSSVNRPAADRNAKAERAGAAAQESKASGEASAIGPPPNGPDRSPPYADAALTTSPIGPCASAAACRAARTLPTSVTSASSGSAPARRTPSSVASERATPATRQPRSSSDSITARPRFRAPKTSADRGCVASSPTPITLPHGRHRVNCAAGPPPGDDPPMRIVTVAEDPELAELAWELTKDAMPEYNNHGDVLNVYWPRLTDEFGEFQFHLIDDAGDLVARARCLPIRWDGTVADLPAGIDRAMIRGFEEGGGNTLCALLISIPRSVRSRGVSRLAVQAMTEIARRNGLGSLIAPVRPNWKERYPLTPIDE